MTDPSILSELEYDALNELFNIGVGRAASAMYELLNEELKLSVSTAKILPQSSLTEELQLQAKRICGVQQNISGLFRANAILLFPEDKSLELVRLMLSETTSHDAMTEMQQESLCEIGNIILNACVGTMANLLNHECHTSLPNFYRGTMDQVLGNTNAQSSELTLIIYINFLLEKQEIRSYLVFLMDTISLADLKVVLQAFLKNIGT